eukprot:3927568-Prymnesium_polylepis.1
MATRTNTTRRLGRPSSLRSTFRGCGRSCGRGERARFAMLLRASVVRAIGADGAARGVLMHVCAVLRGVAGARLLRAQGVLDNRAGGHERLVGRAGGAVLAGQ